MKSVYTRHSIPREHRNTTLWPELDLDDKYEIDDPERIRLLEMKQAVIAFVETQEPSETIARRHKVHRKQLLSTTNRCMVTGKDGRIMGWAGLIPYLRVKPFRRKKALPTSTMTEGNFAGAFDLLLSQYPMLRKKLDQHILKLKRDMTPDEIKQSIKSLHRKFLAWCTGEGISASQYPHFGTKSQARKSVGRYTRDLRLQHWSKGLRAEGLQGAAHRLRVGTGHVAKVFAAAPLDAVQMDAHRLHCVGTVRVPNGIGYTLVPIKRMWVILVVEVFTQAILGYSLAIRSEANAVDVLRALEMSLTAWTPRQITVPGLRYAAGAGFPSGVIEKLAGVGWALLQVDNALVHYSDAVIHRARGRIGCAVNFGSFGSWERRPIVESINARLEARGFQRLASSTGTGPEDPSIQDANAAAVQAQIENCHLVDIVELVIAEHNATAIASLGMKSPLDVLRDFAASQGRLFLARTLPRPMGSMADLSTTIEHRPVRGNRSEGRRPYVGLDGLRYTSPVLSDALALVGTFLTLHIRGSDMRSIRAFLPDGRELGELTAPNGWNTTPWTREEGRLIRSLKEEGTLQLQPGDDVVVAYHGYLAALAQQDAQKQLAKRPKTSQTATTIERIKAEGRGTPVLDQVAVTRPVPVSSTHKLPLGRFESLRASSGTDSRGSK